jgi:lipopolysaccharide O-acetyltransferase
MDKTQRQSLRPRSSFFRENGLYVFLATIADRPFHIMRNRMLAAHLRVDRINIGPRAYLRGLSHVAMGEDFRAGDGLWLQAVTRYGDQWFNPKLTIGNHVRVSHWSHITCTHSVTIGDDVLMGSKVIITDHNHGLYGASATSPLVPPAQRPLESDAFVKIGSNVWLGDGVVVCPGVSMGEGSVAGANAVVTTDVPPFTMVAGVPARAIRRYDMCQKSWISV